MLVTYDAHHWKRGQTAALHSGTKRKLRRYTICIPLHFHDTVSRDYCMALKFSVFFYTLAPCHSRDVSADNDRIDERHRLASDIAKYFLASHREPTREDSRLFEDLQQFALEVLQTVRSRDTVPKLSIRKVPGYRAKFAGIGPASRPVH